MTKIIISFLFNFLFLGCVSSPEVTIERSGTPDKVSSRSLNETEKKELKDRKASVSSLYENYVKGCSKYNSLGCSAVIQNQLKDEYQLAQKSSSDEKKYLLVKKIDLTKIFNRYSAFCTRINYDHSDCSLEMDAFITYHYKEAIKSMSPDKLHDAQKLSEDAVKKLEKDNKKIKV